MSQVEDEYELTRGTTVYQLSVTYDWAGFPLDDEGCPIIAKGAASVVVEKAEILASWRTDLRRDYQLREEEPPYPVLEPPMTEEEVRGFDEWLADQAAIEREQELW